MIGRLLDHVVRHAPAVIEHPREVTPGPHGNTGEKAARGRRHFQREPKLRAEWHRRRLTQGVRPAGHPPLVLLAQHGGRLLPRQPPQPVGGGQDHLLPPGEEHYELCEHPAVVCPAARLPTRRWPTTRPSHPAGHPFADSSGAGSTRSRGARRPLLASQEHLPNSPLLDSGRPRMHPSTLMGNEYEYVTRGVSFWPQVDSEYPPRRLAPDRL